MVLGECGDSLDLGWHSSTILRRPRARLACNGSNLPYRALARALMSSRGGPPRTWSPLHPDRASGRHSALDHSRAVREPGGGPPLPRGGRLRPGHLDHHRRTPTEGPRGHLPRRRSPHAPRRAAAAKRIARGCCPPRADRCGWRSSRGARHQATASTRRPRPRAAGPRVCTDSICVREASTTWRPGTCAARPVSALRRRLR